MSEIKFVSCLECGYQQADMGHNVACEECGARMPTNEQAVAPIKRKKTKRNPHP